MSADTSTAVDVNADAATHFSVVAPASTTAGTSINVTVTALDAYGNIDTDYAGTITFTSTDGAAVLPADRDLPPNQGTDIFAVVLKTAGSRTITATDTADGSDHGHERGHHRQSRGRVQHQPRPDAAARSSPTGSRPRPPPSRSPTASATGSPARRSPSRTSGDVTIGAVSYSGNGIYTATITASKTAGNETITATDVTDGSIAATAILTETPGPVTRLQVLLPGETAAPGSADRQDRHARRPSPRAPRSPSPSTRSMPTGTSSRPPRPTVAITSSDANATLPANAALVAGTRTFRVTLKTAGLPHGHRDRCRRRAHRRAPAPPVTVSAGPATKLQVLLPGETAAPGQRRPARPARPTRRHRGCLGQRRRSTRSTPTGTSSHRATPTVAITSSDANATLPANAALVAGTRTFSVTLKTAGTRTVTATDVAAVLTAGHECRGHGQRREPPPSSRCCCRARPPPRAARPARPAAPTGRHRGCPGHRHRQRGRCQLEPRRRRHPDRGHHQLRRQCHPARQRRAGRRHPHLQRHAQDGGQPHGHRDRCRRGAHRRARVPRSRSAPEPPRSSRCCCRARPPPRAAATGKTGTPTGVTAGAPVSVTVNAVDANWNLVASATPTVAITSSDANATLPANAALVAGHADLRGDAQDRRIPHRHRHVCQRIAVRRPPAPAPRSRSAPGPRRSSRCCCRARPPPRAAPTGKTGTPDGVTAGAPVSVDGQRGRRQLEPRRIRHARPWPSPAPTPMPPCPPTPPSSPAPGRFSVTLRTAGSRTVTATDVAAVLTAGHECRRSRSAPEPPPSSRCCCRARPPVPGSADRQDRHAHGRHRGCPGHRHRQRGRRQLEPRRSATPTVGHHQLRRQCHAARERRPRRRHPDLRVTLKTAGSRTVTATDVAAVLTPGTSAAVTVSAGAATKLQVLLPGETAAPGSADRQDRQPHRSDGGRLLRSSSSGRSTRTGTWSHPPHRRSR